MGFPGHGNSRVSRRGIAVEWMVWRRLFSLDLPAAGVVVIAGPGQIRTQAGGAHAREASSPWWRADRKIARRPRRFYRYRWEEKWRSVRTCSARKPGSVNNRFRKLRSSKPAPIRSTHARLTSLMTSALRRRRCRTLPAMPRPPSRRFRWTSIPDDCSAGASPKRDSAPERDGEGKNEDGDVDVNFVAARETGRQHGHQHFDTSDGNHRAGQPADHRNKQALREHLPDQPGAPAPRASRIAISRRRLVARANSRFAALAQAISRTRPTAPRRTNSMRLLGPTISR